MPPDIRISGKSQVYGFLPAVSNRVDGTVTLCNISDPDSPQLTRRMQFSGHPDPMFIDGSTVYIPLEHQGFSRWVCPAQ